tara:strand:- start:1555 stop:1866 length:312 start_codon:yes stop_codon:yes gene_type:complete
VCKTNYQIKYNYTQIYWEPSNLEEFLIPFIQIFLIPISIKSFVHFDITYYTFDKPIPYSLIWVVGFIGLFAFCNIFLPIIVLFNNKEKLKNLHLFYDEILPKF